MSATCDILGTVQGAIEDEIGDHRARGQPLKAAFHAIARAFQASGAKDFAPRRARAFHHNEIAAEDVRAAEWLAAVELRNRRRRARLAAARALLAEEEA